MSRTPSHAADISARPRLGFLGVGRIGQHRMQAIADAGAGEVAAIADGDCGCLRSAAEKFPGAAVGESLEFLLAQNVDGIVIATPSGLHSAQAAAALRAGKAVFCQKPLGRTLAENEAVVDLAQRHNRLLGVDLSYRHVRGMEQIRSLIESDRLGRIYCAELTFHNAYGPGKEWYFDRARSGGGCLIDLGIHLVDLGLWALGASMVYAAESRLYTQGLPWGLRPEGVEDYASATLDLEGMGMMQLKCSWNLPAGQEALIEATFYGTAGAARLRNLNGSFYDLRAEWLQGTQTVVLDELDNDWGGRAAVAWARRLAQNPAYDPAVESILPVARALDLIYAAAGEEARMRRSVPAVLEAETANIMEVLP